MTSQNKPYNALVRDFAGREAELFFQAISCYHYLENFEECRPKLSGRKTHDLKFRDLPKLFYDNVYKQNTYNEPIIMWSWFNRKIYRSVVVFTRRKDWAGKLFAVIKTTCICTDGTEIKNARQALGV